jgi:predicted DNA-binding transcriptional regulator AlpA
VKKVYQARELIEMGVAGSLPTLYRMIERGFPPGRMISLNRRVWTEEEIDEWFATRPTAKKIVPPRKAIDLDMRCGRKTRREICDAPKKAESA